MPSLLSIRPWLRPWEAAQVLTEMSGTKIQASDVLRCALDGQVELSVFLTSPVHATFVGQIGNIERTRKKEWIDGLFPLWLVGDGRTEIEASYAEAMQYPVVRVGGKMGAFIRKDGDIYELPPQEGSTGYSPVRASALPPEAQIVLTKDAVQRLRDVLAESVPAPVKPTTTDETLGVKERRSLSIIIGSLASLAKVDINAPASAAGAIEAAASELGHKIGLRTIQDHLKAVSEILKESKER